MVARHHHIYAFGKSNLTGYVHRTQIELGTVFVVERRVTAPLFLLQDINLSLELGVRSDRTRFSDNHTALNLFLVDTAEQQTYVVTGLALIEQLAEHLHTRTSRSQRLLLQTDDLNGITYVDNTGFDTARNHGTTAGDREYVLDRHQERLLVLALRNRNIVINRIHQLHDLVFPLSLAVQTTQCGTTDDRSVVAIVVVFAQQITNLHLDQVEHLGIVHHIAFVQEHNDLRYVHLASQQHVLVGLTHRTVGCGNNQNRTVHLCGTGNHVLHIVGVTRAVNVCIVTICSLVLNVRSVDRNTTLFLLGSVVDRIERTKLRKAFFSQNGGDRCSKSRLTVINVTDSTDVHMRFGTVEFFFCHSIKVLRFYKNSALQNVCRFARVTSDAIPLLKEVCITRQLHFWSGRRGSNSRPLAWKANALSTELLPQKRTARSFPFPIDSEIQATRSALFLSGK